MKKVSDSLMNYFVNEKSFLCCDLYQLALEKGKKYFFASYEIGRASCRERVYI